MVYSGLKGAIAMAKLDALATLDACAQAELVRRGEVSPTDPLDACRERCELIEPLIHALVTTDFERARSRAEAARGGRLACVPFVVKDVTPYPGFGWRFGSRLFAHNEVPGPTPYSERLDGAGLLTFGKSATSELGLLGSTETVAAGVTHNPWDLARSAAGSSGGAAAAVAAGLVPLAHASDAGGSIRIPASVCGVFGFMPSKGRVVPAIFGRSDFGDLIVEHCISRSVRDSARLLSLTQATDGGEAIVETQLRLTRRLRLGAYTRTLTGREPCTEVERAFRSALGLCRDLGHEVVELAAPAIDGRALSDAFFGLAGATMAGLFQSMAGSLGRSVALGDVERFTLELAEHQRQQGPSVVAQALAAFEAARQRYLEASAGVDVVVTPTLPELPWELGTLSPRLGRELLIRRTEELVGYTPIHNIVGCPAMSVPLGWSEGGLPVGIHFAGRQQEDALLLGLALELEAASPWFERWAPWSYPALTHV
jgi:amidase